MHVTASTHSLQAQGPVITSSNALVCLIMSRLVAFQNEVNALKSVVEEAEMFLQRAEMGSCESSEAISAVLKKLACFKVTPLQITCHATKCSISTHTLLRYLDSSRRRHSPETSSAYTGIYGIFLARGVTHSG